MTKTLVYIKSVSLLLLLIAASLTASAQTDIAPDPGMTLIDNKEWPREFVVDGCSYYVMSRKMYDMGVCGYRGNTDKNPDVAEQFVLPENVTINGRRFSVKSVVSWTYAGNPTIRSLTIPAGIDSIYDVAFQDCPFLHEVIVEESSVPLMFDWYKNNTSTANMPLKGSNITHFTLRRPSNFDWLKVAAYFYHLTLGGYYTEVNGAMMKNWEKLTAIKLEEGMTRIGANAFTACPVLQDVSLPSTLRFIGAGAFRGCRMITTMELPEGLSGLEARTFEGCAGLRGISLPQSMSQIGDSALRSCNNLRYIFANRPTPPLAADSAFHGVDPDSVMIVVDSKEIKDAYRAAPVWRDFWRVAVNGTTLADSVTLDADSAAMKVGDTFTLTAGVYPEETTDRTIVWQSSDPEVAVVTPVTSTFSSRSAGTVAGSACVVTIVGSGEVEITAVSDDGSGRKSTCTVSVEPEPEPEPEQPADSDEGPDSDDTDSGDQPEDQEAPETPKADTPEIPDEPATPETPEELPDDSPATLPDKPEDKPNGEPEEKPDTTPDVPTEPEDPTPPSEPEPEPEPEEPEMPQPPVTTDTEATSGDRLRMRTDGGNLTIEVAGSARVMIYDMSCRLLLDREIAGEETFGLNRGMYIIKAADTTRKVTID